MNDAGPTYRSTLPPHDPTGQRVVHRTVIDLRKVRNTLLWTGGFLAVGVGTYFGIKSIGKDVEKMVKSLDDIDKTSRIIESHLFNEIDWKNRQRGYIDEAINSGDKFKFYPGLGVRYKVPFND